MTSIRLTPRQKEGLERGVPKVLEAGAGSGKTRVLTERILTLLGLSGSTEAQNHRTYSPDQVVAITFTKKATAEIRGRISEAAQARWRELAKASSSHLPEWAQSLDSLLFGLRSLEVLTIDGLFRQLITPHFGSLGFPADPRILDPREGKWLAREALAQVLDRSGKSQEGRGSPSLRLALEAYGNRFHLESRLKLLVSAGLPLEAWAKAGPEFFLERFQKDLESDLRQAMEAIHRIPGIRQDLDLVWGGFQNLSGNDALSALWAPTFGVRYQGRLDEAFVLRILTQFATKKGLRSVSRLGSQGNWGGKEAISLVREATQRILEGLEPFQWIQAAREAASREQSAAEGWWPLIQLGAEVQAEYQERKLELGVVDFRDLRAALEKLRAEPTWEAVLAAWRAQKPVFLLDEMQDTDPAQWDLLRPLVAPRQEGVETFLVGDPKQAIYGFRGADVHTFLRAQRELSHLPGTEESRTKVSLVKNFRTNPALLESVNELFAPLFAQGPKGVQVDFTPLEPGLPDGPARFEIHAVDETPDPDSELSRRGPFNQFEALATRIQELVHGPEAVDPGEIAILLRKRTRQAELLEALRRRAIPYQTSGGVGFFQTSEVQDAIHLLAVLRDPHQDLELATTLRSPFFSFSDDALLALAWRRPPGASLWSRLAAYAGDAPEAIPEELGPLGPELEALYRESFRTLETWISWCRELPASEAIPQILDASAIWGVLRLRPDGPQALSNLVKFLGLLEGYPESFSELSRRAQEWAREETQEAEADILAPGGAGAVQVMTIHASKGLEFPYVFLPDLASQGRPGGSNRVLLPPGELPAFSAPLWLLEIPPFPRSSSSRAEAKQPYSFLRAQRLLKEREAAEEIRLFYVACTRAERGLFLYGASDESKPRISFSNFLSGKHWMGQSLAALGVEAEDFEVGFKQLSRLKVPLIRDLPVLEASPEEAPTASDPSDLAAPPEAWADLSAWQALRVPERVSPQVLALARCPRRFQIRSQFGFQPEEGGAFWGAASRPHTRALWLGRAIHAGLEAWVQDPGSKQAFEVPGWELTRAYDLDSPTRALVEEEALDGLQSFLDTELAAEIRAAKRVWSELEVSAELGPTLLRGTLDCLVQTQAGELLLIDFKTDRPAPRVPVEEWMQLKAPEYLEQLLAYALGVRARFPDQARLTIALAFVQAESHWSLELDLKDPSGPLAAFQAQALERLEGIFSGRFRRQDALEEITPATCQSCPFQLRCPESLAPEASSAETTSA